jgi:hypothetical protein
LHPAGSKTYPAAKRANAVPLRLFSLTVAGQVYALAGLIVTHKWGKYMQITFRPPPPTSPARRGRGGGMGKYAFFTYVTYV